MPEARSPGVKVADWKISWQTRQRCSQVSVIDRLPVRKHVATWHEGKSVVDPSTRRFVMQIQLFSTFWTKFARSGSAGFGRSWASFAYGVDRRTLRRMECGSSVPWPPTRFAQFSKILANRWTPTWPSPATRQINRPVIIATTSCRSFTWWSRPALHLPLHLLKQRHLSIDWFNPILPTTRRHRSITATSVNSVAIPVAVQRPLSTWILCW